MNTLTQHSPLMSVTPSEKTYQPKAPKVAKSHALTELFRIGEFTVEKQEQESKQLILIGGIRTWWTKPVSKDAIPHKSIRTGPKPRLAIWDEHSSSIALYEMEGPKDWRRLLFSADPADIIAALPKSAIEDLKPTRVATENQIKALRKILEISESTVIPVLHFAAASRIMERVLVEGVVSTLRVDLGRLRGPVPINRQ